MDKVINDVDELIDYIEKNADIINWKVIHENDIFLSLPVEFIWKFRNELDWKRLTSFWNHDIPYYFIDYFSDYVNWTKLMHNQLPEDILRKHHDKIGWYFICLKQRLSKEFLTEFKDKVNWNFILYYNITMTQEEIKELYSQLFNGKILV